MSCVGGFFSPGGAYNSVWDSVKPIVFQHHFVDRLPCCGGVCVAMSCCGGSFNPDGTYDSVWVCVWPLVENTLGCVCLLNGWFSNIDDICADNFFFSRVKLKDKCRRNQWEVYLCGDMTILVMRLQVQFLGSGDMPVVVTTGHGVLKRRKLRMSPQLQFMA